MEDESTSSLSDLFSDDASSDDYVPPTESEDDEDTDFKRKRKTLNAVYKPIKKPRSTVPSSKLLKRPKESHEEEVTRNTPNTPERFTGLLAENESLDQDEILEPENRPVLTGINVEETPKKKPRKVISNPSKWKNNIIKKKCQAGEAYISRRGKQVLAKEVKNLKDCIKACKFKCSSKISTSERIELHKSYYSLSYNEKRHFLISTSERSLTSRPKISENGVFGDKRKYSFRYFFWVKGEKVQVCKTFYLGTLSISQRPVYTAHSLKNTETNTPPQDKRGKSASSRRVPVGDVGYAREHIESFPQVESHYCRAKTNRLYLGSDLSISKMYNLYLEKCNDNSIMPVKQSQYHKIFVTEYNFGFHIPKSDRCEMCERYKMASNTNTITDQLTKDYKYHIVAKSAMREEAKKDRANNDTPVLLFDLQNVITCPRVDIGPFFYKRKLNLYNMTAYLSTTKQVYCAIWQECMAGRAGNDLASAVRKILDTVAAENDLTNLVTWSDSCVPQNRNSIMSYAVLDFLRDHNEVESVTMKYSVPGHSCVQSVDSVHSVIERAMEGSEFYSPIGFIRILLQANRKRPYRVIQMKENDFKDFGAVAKLLNYKNVPYTKICNIKHTQTLHEIEFKTSHDAFEPANLASLKFEQKTRKESKRSNGPTRLLSGFDVRPKVEKKKEEISELKKKDIKSMFSCMPSQDRAYFEAILHIKGD